MLCLVINPHHACVRCSFLRLAFPRKVYLSLAEWTNKKELEETTKYTSAGQLPPDIATAASSPSDSDEEGNRLQRRMAKKEKRKSGKI